jgi:steroid delta-isomerase-like uncharacterized protein
MSVQNQALARRIFEDVWSGGKLEYIDQLFSPEFVGHPTGLDDEIRGPGGTKEFVARFREAFPDIAFTVEDQMAEGDTVVTRWRAYGTHDGELMGIEPTGRRATVTGITIQQFRDGKVMEGWTNWDTLGLLTQLGAVPQPTRA